MERRRVKAGDTKRRRWRLAQAGGRVIDLTNASGVLMLAALAPGQSAEGTTSLSGACTVEAPPSGGVVLEPAGGTGALAEALYRVEFQITFSDGQVETVPDEDWQLLEVIPDLN